MQTKLRPYLTGTQIQRIISCLDKDEDEILIFNLKSCVNKALNSKNKSGNDAAVTRAQINFDKNELRLSAYNDWVAEGSPLDTQSDLVKEYRFANDLFSEDEEFEYLKTWLK